MNYSKGYAQALFANLISSCSPNTTRAVLEAYWSIACAAAEITERDPQPIPAERRPTPPSPPSPPPRIEQTAPRPPGVPQQTPSPPPVKLQLGPNAGGLPNTGSEQ